MTPEARAWLTHFRLRGDRVDTELLLKVDEEVFKYWYLRFRRELCVMRQRYNVNAPEPLGEKIFATPLSGYGLRDNDSVLSIDLEVTIATVDMRYAITYAPNSASRGRRKKPNFYRKGIWEVLGPNRWRVVRFDRLAKAKKYLARELTK